VGLVSLADAERGKIPCAGVTFATPVSLPEEISRRILARSSGVGPSGRPQSSLERVLGTRESSGGGNR
jgi:hypothetical protein